jgi:predicted PurR-regulated permease PerM
MKRIPRLVGYILTVSFFTLLITAIFATQIQPAYAQVNINTKDNTTDSNSMQNDILLITKILAKNLENHLQKAGALLEITSALPQVRNVSYAHFLNQTLETLHGIPKDADMQKRQVAQSILSEYKELQIIRTVSKFIYT